MDQWVDESPCRFHMLLSGAAKNDALKNVLTNKRALIAFQETQHLH